MLKIFFLGALLMGASAPLLADSQPPSDVNGLSGSAISSTSIRLTWNKPWDDTGVAGYNVYRNDQYFKTVWDTNYIDNAVSANSSYRYAIVAFDNPKNFSNHSATITVNTGGNSAPPAPASQSSGLPGKPTNLRREILNGNKARIQWDRPAGNVTGYNVYRDNQYITTVKDTSYSTQWIDWGKDYRYHVYAMDQAINFSPPSDKIIVNTSANSSTAAQAVAQPQNDGSNNSPHAGYNLVFSEDFRGNSVDSSKWSTRYRWGPDWIINNERQYYIDTQGRSDLGSPFEFDGEHMSIVAKRVPDWQRAQTNWQQYSSGVITTYNKFSMKYGYVEMRAKLPSGRGLWPAFFLMHENEAGIRPEMDVMELHGQRPDLVYQTYHHYINGWELISSPSYEAYGPDFSQDFHTFSVKWEPGLITWYIDGQEKNRHQHGNVSWENMYLILNLAAGGSWPGDPDGSTPFPNKLTVDYIRAYQKP